jgi:hypothetical protein
MRKESSGDVKGSPQALEREHILVTQQPDLKSGFPKNLRELHFIRRL